MLREHVWAFTKKFVTLAPMAEASEISPWEHKFQLPADVARIVSLSYADEELTFERLGDVLHTTTTEADLRYVRNFAPEDDGFPFPDDFAEVLACLLASDLAIAITQTQAYRETYMVQAKERLRTAMFNGAVERNNYVIHSSSWIDAHDGWPTSEIDPSRRGLSGH